MAEDYHYYSRYSAYPRVPYQHRANSSGSHMQHQPTEMKQEDMVYHQKYASSTARCSSIVSHPHPSNGGAYHGCDDYKTHYYYYPNKTRKEHEEELEQGPPCEEEPRYPEYAHHYYEEYRPDLNTTYAVPVKSSSYPEGYSNYYEGGSGSRYNTTSYSNSPTEYYHEAEIPPHTNAMEYGYDYTEQPRYHRHPPPPPPAVVRHPNHAAYEQQPPQPYYHPMYDKRQYDSEYRNELKTTKDVVVGFTAPVVSSPVSHHSASSSPYRNNPATPLSATAEEEEEQGPSSMLIEVGIQAIRQKRFAQTMGESSPTYYNNNQEEETQPQILTPSSSSSSSTATPKASSTKTSSKKPRKKKKMYSNYIGVTYNKTHSKFQACITHYRKQHYLGRYKLAADAARAYDQGAKLLKGKDWKVNFETTQEYVIAKHKEELSPPSKAFQKKQEQDLYSGSDPATTIVPSPSLPALEPNKVDSDINANTPSLKMKQSTKDEDILENKENKNGYNTSVNNTLSSVQQEKKQRTSSDNTTISCPTATTTLASTPIKKPKKATQKQIIKYHEEVVQSSPSNGMIEAASVLMALTHCTSY